MFRLKTVYIKDYKNIKDQIFDFSNNTGYIAFIGLNGSGKSNLLEAISIILNNLYGIPHQGQVNGYSITFQLDGIDYTYATVDDTEEHNIIPLTAVDTENLPSSIIACYSGEDLRLWHMAFEDYYMQYFRGAIRNRSFSPKIVYINKYCWKIAFISLLCSQKDTVKEFLKNVFSIDDIISVDIHIEADAKKRDKFASHAACKWYDRIKQLQDEDENQLINANAIASIDMRTYGAPNEDAPNYVFQFLYLLSLPKKDKVKKQTIDKLINDIRININGVDFDGLSEGEKKLILIECITQILGDENSLVLLDEPDAHVHIENKKKILETIEQYHGQTILTTHSPTFTNFIIDTQNIKFIKNGILVDTSKLQQLKQISGNAIDYFEGAFVLSSKNILVTEGIYDIRYLRKAIEVFGKRNPKYKRLNELGMLYAGSASEGDVIYNELIQNKITKLDKIVFLFDYDKGGLEGWKKVNPIALAESKVVPIFYQQDYSISLDTATDKVIQQDSITVEDLFAPDAYASLFTNPSVMEATHKYFRCRQKITDRIKEYLQKNYSTIADAHYDNYEPLLDKLLSLFFNI